MNKNSIVMKFKIQNNIVNFLNCLKNLVPFKAYITDMVEKNNKKQNFHFMRLEIEF